MCSIISPINLHMQWKWQKARQKNYLEVQKTQKSQKQGNNKIIVIRNIKFLANLSCRLHRSFDECLHYQLHVFFGANQTRTTSTLTIFKRSYFLKMLHPGKAHWTDFIDSFALMQFIKLMLLLAHAQLCYSCTSKIPSISVAELAAYLTF